MGGVIAPAGRWSFGWVVAAVFAGYYLAAKLGMALAFQPDFISALWPANSVLLTALLLTEPRRWIWLLAATVPAELLADLPAGISLPGSLHFLAGDWTEAALCAIALRRVQEKPAPLASLKTAGWFVLCAVILAPLAAGFAMAATAGAEEESIPFLLLWRRWFLGDALAHATITPCLLSLFAGGPLLPTRRSLPRLAEGFALYVAIGALAAVSFGALGSELTRERAWTFAPLPVLIYAAVRFGTRVTYTASSILAIVGVWAAAFAPFEELHIPDLQISLLLSVLPVLLLSALMEERRATIGELASQETRLEGILDSLGVGVVAVESKGGSIIYANPAAARMAGHPAENLLGLKLINLLPLQLPGVGHLLPGEQELHAAGGHRVPVLVTQTQTRLRGRTCTLASLTDVTRFKEAEQERARLEDELRQAAKMESIGRLAGGIAHDFNNILQVISGHLAFAEQALPPGVPARTHLSRIGAASSHAAQLVRQLLAFSRRHSMRSESLDLNRLMKDVTLLLRPMLDETIELRFEPSAELPTIEADPHLLEQVIFNLCSNARDAMPQGGRLLLATSSIDLTEEELRGETGVAPGRFVRLIVCDTGMGMDAATRERIFEPFFTTKEQGRGTGLGLATVYGIVKQHRGLIRVESEPGAGTTFCIYLPAHGKPETPPAAGPEPMSQFGSGTILLAEDNDAVRDSETAVLRRAGYTVHAAANGEEAFALFRRYSREVDLLVLDVVMPLRSGIETAALIRREAPDLPVLFTSGYSEMLNRDPSGEREYFPFLPKPHSRDELLRAVRAALESAAKETTA